MALIKQHSYNAYSGLCGVHGVIPAEGSGFHAHDHKLKFRKAHLQGQHKSHMCSVISLQKVTDDVT